MSHFFLKDMKPELMQELLTLLHADHAPLVLLSSALMVLRQTDAAASLLGTGQFYSVEGILSSEACSAIRLCIEQRTFQSISEHLDSVLYTIEVHPVEDGALLRFVLQESMKEYSRVLAIQQNQKMRDSLSLILMASSNMKRQNLDEKGHIYTAIVRQNALRLLRSLEHQDIMRASMEDVQLNLSLDDLAELCRSLTAEVRHCLTNSKAQLSLDCPETLTAVFDSQQLSLAIYNLISNSLKYGGPEVTIVLKVERRDRSIYLSVTDNGPGMSDEALHWACDGYRYVESSDASIPPSSAGWGLGIPLARKIAAMHAGVLFISSGTGAGTTVTIAFPDHLNTAKTFNQWDCVFSSNGFHMAEIELSTVLDYDNYQL